MSTIKTPYSRKINPETGDYVISGSEIESEDPIKQQIFLALKTVKGTSADDDLGQEFTSMKVIKDNYESEVTKYVNEALKRLIDAKKIIITNIVVYKEKSRLGIQIGYQDLTKNISQIIKV